MGWLPPLRDGAIQFCCLKAPLFPARLGPLSFRRRRRQRGQSIRSQRAARRRRLFGPFAGPKLIIITGALGPRRQWARRGRSSKSMRRRRRRQLQQQPLGGDTRRPACLWANTSVLINGPPLFGPQGELCGAAPKSIINFQTGRQSGRARSGSSPRSRWPPLRVRGGRGASGSGSGGGKGASAERDDLGAISDDVRQPAAAAARHHLAAPAWHSRQRSQGAPIGRSALVAANRPASQSTGQLANWPTGQLGARSCERENN